VLSATPAGAHIAGVLARGGNEGLGALAVEEHALSSSAVVGHDGDEDVRVRAAETLPLITGDGVLEVLHCRLSGAGAGAGAAGVIEVGDHVVLVAEVLGTVRGAGAGAAVDPRTLGLAYLMRDYQMQEGEGLVPARSNSNAGGVDDIYAYTPEEPEEKGQADGQAQAGGGNTRRLQPRMGFRGSSVAVGKSVNAAFVSAKRWTKAGPSNGTAVETAALEGSKAQRDDEELGVQPTLGLNVRRGDEGLSEDKVVP